MRALLFGASVAFAVAATNKCLEAKAEEAAVCDQTGLISDPALAYSAYCSTACAEALLKIRHWCPDICSADMSTEAAYSVYASDRLAKCDNCIGASVEVAAKCGTDLGKTGDDAVATYCTDEQCSYALQKQAAYCVTSSSLADDKENINPYAAFVSGSITFQTNADALKVQAVAALEHCAPSSTGVNPEDLLQSNRKSAELWTEFLQRYYATSTPFTSIQEALQSIAPGLTLCSATSGTCPEGCDSCGSMEMTMATCPKRWTEAKLAKCVGSGTWSGGSPGSGTCTVPNNAECTLLHSAGGDAVCTQSSDDISVDCPNRQDWPKVCAPGFGPAYRGSAFSQTLQFQAASWSGSPPIDWETKALLYQDATSLTLPPSLTDAYGFNRLANMYTFARANNSGGTVTVNENVLELVINSPINNGGRIAIHASPISQILLTNVWSDSDQPLSFSMGHINLASGVNYGSGPIEFTTPGRVVASDLQNFGTVTFTGTPKLFLLGSHNMQGGVISFTNAAGTVYSCTNAGTMSATDTQGTLDSVANLPGGVLNVVSGVYNMANASNFANAAININSGTFTFTGNLLVNRGTINVGTGVIGRRLVSGRRLAAPTITVEGGVNHGTINIIAGTIAITLDANHGPITLGAGVTGTVALGIGSTVTTLAGPGASAITVTQFVPSGGAPVAGGGGGTPVGAIVGGVVGGVALVLVAAVSFYMYRKRVSVKSSKTAAAPDASTQQA